MINIAQALINIKNAYYGNEVRNSIHDAIYLINEKAESAVSNAEGSKESAKAYAELSASRANESKDHADQSSVYAEESKQYSIQSSSKASDALESAQSAANSYQMIQDALANDVPNFEYNIETGHLFYTGAFLLHVNEAGHLIWSVN